ncbi:hypothetical protein [Nitrospira sp. KM1]|uniref:hypothetical protein n=1 Tax=Nitrospira sp. KM1 TaxID=1936990 RepID=UPI0015678974|nr:hypothetical protein [Nitrospira sp. KM1]
MHNLGLHNPTNHSNRDCRDQEIQRVRQASTAIPSRMPGPAKNIRRRVAEGIWEALERPAPRAPFPRFQGTVPQCQGTALQGLLVREAPPWVVRLVARVPAVQREEAAGKINNASRTISGSFR